MAEVSGGQIATLFVRNDGSISAVGSNLWGQFGDGTVGRQVNATFASTRVAQISASTHSTFFITNDGTLLAAGANSLGQLGDGTTTDRAAPVTASINAAQVSAGYNHTLFTRTNGTLFAMGGNFELQLGDGTTTNRPTPVQVATGVAWVAAGSQHTHFIKTDGTLWAMGSGATGVLGDGTRVRKLTPVQIATGVARVYSNPSVSGNGVSHTLFIKTDGTLWGMGSNGNGQLGLGDTDDRLTPTLIATNVMEAAVGGYHSLFIKTDGSIWGMGANIENQLNGTLLGDALSPVNIGSQGLNVAAGLGHSLFLRSIDARITNLSVRSNAGSGAQTLIAGFNIGGTGQKPILIRGIGPTLTTFQVPNALSDPQLKLFNSASVQLQQNDNWGGTVALSNAFAATGAFRLPANSRDAALLVTLPTGGYSAHITSTGGTGVALMEAYDPEGLTSPTRLTNVSIRNQVGTGGDIVILGLAISGNGPKTLLIRGVGPTLASFDVPGTIADPQIDIYTGNTRIAGNDNWGGSPSLRSAFDSVGAFGFLTNTSRDAAIVITLPLGGHTVHMSGVGGSTGVGLVEVYELP